MLNVDLLNCLCLFVSRTPNSKDSGNALTAGRILQIFNQFLRKGQDRLSLLLSRTVVDKHFRRWNAVLGGILLDIIFFYGESMGLSSTVTNVIFFMLVYVSSLLYRPIKYLINFSRNIFTYFNS
jgi:hypothetical protein